MKAKLETALPHFKNLRFGKTSAEKESLEWPELLTKGYFDPYGLIPAAKQKGPFLFLGYKGSGKSAIGEHLRLSAEDDPEMFVTYLSLGDFPYTPFSKIVKGDMEPEAKYPTAWSWVILLQLIDQFAKDMGSSLHGEREAYEAYSKLKDSGLLPSSGLAHIVQVTTKRSRGLDAKLFHVGTDQTESSNSISDIPFLVEKLKAIVLRIRSTSQHLLVVDGLDEIMTKREKQYESITALIYEADRLNNQFSRSGCPAKIIILCRTDIYECLPNANKNKIRQDSSVHLDWFHDPHSPQDSHLIQLANHRASLSVGKPVDIFEQWLPPEINHQDTRRFLLELTRHTPRDFITLLNFVQKYSDPDGPVLQEHIISAARGYSVDYFVPEIKDELHGHLSPLDIEQLIQLFSGLGKREFTYGDLQDCAQRFNPELSVSPDEALFNLFECSAIAMLEKVDGKTFFTVKYRNRNAILDLGKKLILHRGMWKALNLQ